MILQEKLKHDPWKLLVGCVLLNLTSRAQVDTVIDRLFERWPDPVSMSQASLPELIEVLMPLGLYNRRAATLKSLSAGFIERKRSTNRGTLLEEDVEGLPGVGPYALDSYRIFVLGDRSRFDSGDKVLEAYLDATA